MLGFIGSRFRWSVCTSLIATAALGQPSQSDKAAADALFEAARGLMQEGNYAEACPKLADSQQLDPAIGTLLNLGRCYVGNGQTASAWTTYREAAARARAEGQTEREALARKEASKLEPRLTRVVIHVSEEAAQAGVTVKQDGKDLPQTVWGVPMPVDPGEHVLEARAPGKVPLSAKFNAVGEGVTIPVKVAPLVDEVAEPTPVVGNGGPTGTTGTTGGGPIGPVAGGGGAGGGGPIAGGGGTPPPDTGTGSQKLLGYIAGGVGAGALALGGVFSWMRKDKNDDAKALCVGQEDACPEYNQWKSARDDAVSNRNRSYIAWGVGGALLATGGVLLLTAGTDQHQSSRLRVVGGIGPKQGLLGVSGKF